MRTPVPLTKRGYVHIPYRTDAATGVEGLLKPCLYDTAEKHLNTVYECGGFLLHS